MGNFTNEATDRWHFCAVIIMISSLFLFTECQDKTPVPRDFPQLNTLEVGNITSSGALLQADITSLGAEPIVELGFVWGLAEPSLSSDDKVLVSIPSSTGIFSAEIHSALLKVIRYHVKPYAKTASFTVYGKPVDFVSMGALAPVITGFEPKTAGWLDTIIVKGRKSNC